MYAVDTKHLKNETDDGIGIHKSYNEGNEKDREGKQQSFSDFSKKVPVFRKDFF